MTLVTSELSHRTLDWEVFYTPRWRPGTNHLILEGGWDLQYRDPRIYKDAP